MGNILELQCSVDDWFKFLELSMFINASLPQICYMMKWIGDSDIKKHFVKYHLCIFFLKVVMNDLNKWFAVTLVEKKYCAEKDDHL